MGMTLRTAHDTTVTAPSACHTAFMVLSRSLHTLRSEPLIASQPPRRHPMQKRHWMTLAPLAATALLFSACATTTPAPTTVAQTISANPQLSTASRLISEAGLTETLQGA